MTNTTAELVALAGDVSNSGIDTIILERPYTVSVEIEGDAPILFHRWQSDAVEAKAAAAKGSKAKKSDDVESYVWRNSDNLICIPGEYFRGTMVNRENGAAKYRQDPRSPRKSALDLYRAGVIALTDLAPLITNQGRATESWDYLDRRRVTVNRAGVTRERPAFNAGWKAEFELMVLLPNYISPSQLRQTLYDAGRLVGIADFRPTYGRFSLTHFEVLTDD